MFRFEYPELGIDDNVRLAAKGEFDRAIAEVSETGFEVHETVRNVRRRLKRVRAILRLIRPVFPSFAKENAALRDMGGAFSDLRDAMALVEAVDLLDRAQGGDVLDRLRQKLLEHAALQESALDRDAFLTGLRTELRDARVRSELWEFARTDSKALVPGFVATYRHARRGLKRARTRRHEEDFHEWRKAVKHHAAQLSLLSGVMPLFAEARRRRAKRLARTLGELQNLCVLSSAITVDGIVGEADGALVKTLIAREVAALSGKALKQGAPLFAEKPAEVERRWLAYWGDWQAARRLG